MKRDLTDYLQSWLRKPESVRRRAAALAAGGITLVIFLLWLLNLKFTGSLVPAAAPTPAVQTAAVRATVAEILARLQAGWRVLLERLD